MVSYNKKIKLYDIAEDLALLIHSIPGLGLNGDHWLFPLYFRFPYGDTSSPRCSSELWLSSWVSPATLFFFSFLPRGASDFGFRTWGLVWMPSICCLKRWKWIRAAWPFVISIDEATSFQLTYCFISSGPTDFQGHYRLVLRSNCLIMLYKSLAMAASLGMLRDLLRLAIRAGDLGNYYVVSKWVIKKVGITQTW